MTYMGLDRVSAILAGIDLSALGDGKSQSAVSRRAPVARGNGRRLARQTCQPSSAGNKDYFPWPDSHVLVREAN